MTPRVLTPDDVVAAAVTVEAALRPVAGRDWSVQAGPLEWDVEQTITHMLGATAKYTLYLASRCQHCTPTTPSAVPASCWPLETANPTPA
jgi:hypothetical protein